MFSSCVFTSFRLCVHVWRVESLERMSNVLLNQFEKIVFCLFFVSFSWAQARLSFLEVSYISLLAWRIEILVVKRLRRFQGFFFNFLCRWINPLSAKPSFQLWYPGGQRLKVISFSWSGVKSLSKCFSNTEPTTIIASRDEKRCNASVQWTRSVHLSSLRLSDQHRKCHGWLLFFAVPALQPDRPAAVHYPPHVHENSEVRNGSDVESRKQAPQNSLVCRWWRFESSHNHTLTSLYFFSLLDHGSSHTTRTNRDDEWWSFCARSRQRPEVEFSF